MTLTHRISTLLISLFAALAVTFGAAWLGYQSARGDAGVAEHMVEASALPDAGSASAPAPADKLHDPASSPKAAWDDLRAAKKDGWAIAAFAALVMLCKLASRVGKKFKWLAFLGKGKVAIVVGAAGALATACYNAAAEGGAWSAMLMAGAVAVAGYLDLGEKASSS
jgi:hypothetical protein